MFVVQRGAAYESVIADCSSTGFNPRPSSLTVVRFHLGGLARDELPEYLDHRLRLAGTSLPLLEPAAVQALYQATQGLPRKVNLIAHYALSAAALAKARQITAEHVQSALEEVQ